MQGSFKQWKSGIAVTLVALLVVLVVSQTPVSAVDPPSTDLNTGPYVDNLIYKVIESEDQRILAIQAGEIEMDTEVLSPGYLPILSADPDIEIYSALRNGYGHITINCDKYPLNISGFRRAFAFSFDKTAVTVDIMDGFSQEHDSLVPYANGWCVEDEFDWNYYTQQSEIGNQILDDLGFEINSETGYRDAPNGNPFEIAIFYAYTSDILGGAAQIAVDALHRLHVNARITSNDYMIPMSEIILNYDMIVYETNFYSNDVSWLAYDYWSENAGAPDGFLNPSNFRNATYDSWRDQLLYGTTYEEVHEAAAEMQKILHYNVPRLVVYQNTYMQMYRNDLFTGHVEDLGRYISGPWTMRKIHKLDGTFGGTVPIAIKSGMETFNFMTTQSSFSEESHAIIFDNLYPSLYKRGPDLNPWPDLAENMITETHDDNVAIPEGHTRFTIDIIQNATWSDGEPLTAEDVAFTFTYQYESGTFGNPAALDIAEIVAAYTPTPYRVIMEFSTESYWHFSNFAFDYIIPEHIFNDETGIGYEGWEDWNPVFNPADPHVTCGPFVLTDYEEADFYELSNNPLFHYTPSCCPPVRPFINSEAAIEIEAGTIGNEIVWTTYGSYPDSYSIFMNGTLRESGEWTGGEIRHNIDGLEIGTYMFSLTIVDTDMYEDTEFVIVYVREISLLHLLLSPITIAISSISSVVILVVLVQIFRNKKLQRAHSE